MSVCRPAAISGQPPAWASVGPSGNRRSNQVRTAGWKRSRIAAPASETVAWVGELTAMQKTLQARWRLLGAQVARESASRRTLDSGEQKLACDRASWRGRAFVLAIATTLVLMLPTSAAGAAMVGFDPDFGAGGPVLTPLGTPIGAADARVNAIVAVNGGQLVAG